MMSRAKVKEAVVDLVTALEDDIDGKEAELEREIKSRMLELEMKKKELNQLRQRLHSLEQKWR